MQRLVLGLGRASTITGATGGSGQLELQERRLRGYIEEFLARSGTSGCVALGRGGMVVLRTVPSALHVHLGGPRDARIRQGMVIHGLDRSTAARLQEHEDKARIGYVRRAYGVDGDDLSLYHLTLDPTPGRHHSSSYIRTSLTADR